MTTGAIKAFAVRLSEDDALAASLGARLKGISDRVRMAAETTEFAHANGFDLTESEVSQFVAALDASRNGELSDTVLDDVVGAMTRNRYL
ncbi:MAG: hypothetical protein KJ904_05760 [Alphaproteobacteria bacterium]|nr:hypothetical protein [Alphaproteobacteria bacterium]MBU0795789.1 hypothetical protein [Alphaproteobacteria bacterium]MBU0886651.1 hypothetical protein [Alphaproteobacteria bacterium]MBU1814506.1 hypothetical protein [Alphaproteobacteria bacterium]